MTITNSSTRLAVFATGFVVAAALIGAVAIAPAQAAALSQTQVSAIVNLLQSFGADSATIANVTAALNGQATGGTSGGSTGGACPVLTRTLQQGSNGADVMSLQVFLNASADTRVAVSGAGSPGMETTNFGPATKAAVIKFQAKNNVSPIGVVGPATRAAIAAVCGTTGGSTGGTTGGSTGSLQGGEGTLLVNSVLGDVETDVDEGEEDIKVLGVELEADDSDIMLERVDVDIAVGTGGSSQLDNYITEVSLWLGSTRIATLDVDEGDEDSSDIFSFRFTGLRGVIEEGEEENLYVAVSAISNVDSGDTDVTLDIDIPDNGIRAVDAAGISETYVDGTPDPDGGFTVTGATVGDLDISEGDDNPEGQVVTVDEDVDTDDVLVLEFELEANDQDVTVDDLPVGLVVSENEGVDGPVKNAVLKANGTQIDSKSIPASAGTSYQVLFDDLDYDIDEGDTVVFQVLVDLNDADVTTFATSSTLYATTTGSDASWDVEDSNGDAVTPDGSVSNSGDLLVFHTEGVSVELVSTSESVTFEGDGTAGQKQVGTFTIVVDITANGEDMYIDKSATRDTGLNPDGVGSAGNGFMYGTTSESTLGTSTISAVMTASGSTSGDSTNTFKINSGDTRRFTLTISSEAQNDGVMGFQLYGVNWDDEDGASSANFYTSNMSDFKTDLLTLLVH